MSDSVEKSLFITPTSEHSGPEDDSTLDSDVPPPPPRPCKKPKGGPKKTVKAASVRKMRATTKKVDKRKNTNSTDSEIDVEPPEEPKPKKVKLRTRDEIEVAAKNIEENESQETRNVYADVMRSMSGLSLPQATVVGGKKSQAIAIIDKITATEPNLASDSKQADLQRVLTTLIHPVLR
jgi:hypothetical protein